MNKYHKYNKDNQRFTKKCLTIGEICMQYMGGKSRIARKIGEVIINEVSRWKVKNKQRNIESNIEIPQREREFISLFCGSCAVESKVAEHFDKVTLNDSHEYLIEMFKGVQNGYELPENITEEQYKYIKSHKDENKVLSGFVGFGCSFGGKWFGGYARNKTNTNYAAQSKRSLLKDMNTLYNADFICKDYQDVELSQNCIIYADPPYNNTTGYGKEKFDSAEFWEYAREVSKTHLMFISEQEAPEDFVSIWEKPFTRTLDVNKNNQFKVTEKLFIHKCNLKEREQ